MNDERPGGDSDDVGSDDVDTGQPITQLATLLEPTSEHFLDRVRGRIERRMLGSHVMTFVWHAPVAVFLEFVSMAFEMLAPPPPPPRGGDSR